jgi:hypothetical protein
MGETELTQAKALSCSLHFQQGNSLSSSTAGSLFRTALRTSVSYPPLRNTIGL